MTPVVSSAFFLGLVAVIQFLGHGDANALAVRRRRMPPIPKNLFPKFRRVSLLTRSASQPRTGAFNHNTAKYLAIVSSLTYYSPATVRSQTCTNCRLYKSWLSGFRLHSVLSSRERMRVIVAVDTRVGAIVVAFRGSTNWRNWWNNFRFILKGMWPGNPCGRSASIHAGFQTTYMSVRQQLKAALASVVARHPRTRHILVTGHSLGGAMALLSTLDVRQWYPSYSTSMYNYGAPVVGNTVFVACYNRIAPVSYRVIHKTDVVTLKVAPGFRHVGTAILDPKRHGSALNFLAAHLVYYGVCLGGLRLPWFCPEL